MNELDKLVGMIESIQAAAKANERDAWEKYQKDDTKFAAWFGQLQRLNALTDVLISAYKFQKEVILRPKEPTDAA